MKKEKLIQLGTKEYHLKINDILLILQKNLNISNEKLFFIETIKDEYIKLIIDDFISLSKGKQIEYIINKTNFFGLDFFTDSRVLIPRNDTEILVEKVIEKLKNTKLKKQDFLLIDVGTGTSCIPISIVKNTEILAQNTFLVDISKKALEVSKINTLKYNLQTNHINSSLLDFFIKNNTEKLKQKNIIITANLPYIKNKDFKNMDKEVIDYEPSLALYGGAETGFEMYEKLIKQCFTLVQKYSLKTLDLFIEIGFDQYDYSKTFLNKNKLKFVYFKDKNRIHRVINIKGFK